MNIWLVEICYENQNVISCNFILFHSYRNLWFGAQRNTNESDHHLSRLFIHNLPLFEVNEFFFRFSTLVVGSMMLIYHDEGFWNAVTAQMTLYETSSDFCKNDKVPKDFLNWFSRTRKVKIQQDHDFESKLSTSSLIP